MSKNILKEISNFTKNNNSYSDLNIVNNLLSNTKYKSNKSNNKNLQLGGNNIVSDSIVVITENDISTHEQTNLTNIIADKVNSNKNNNNNSPIKTNDILHTIKEGTLLYYVLNDKFNNISDIEFKSFFTPNFRLATDKINNYIGKNKGYIYTFIVKKDIPNIIIKLHDNIDIIDTNILKSYNGIGFIYPKNEIEAFSTNLSNRVENPSSNLNLMESNTYSQFILTNPLLYLTIDSNICRCESLTK
jgi:hypothetical protein